MAVLLCCAGGVLGAADARAQFATVRGRVTDAAAGTPLQGVNLVLDSEDGRRIGTATDEEGRFTFPHLPPGGYVLQASFVGYAARADTLALDFDDDVELALQLWPEASALDEVIVETEQEGEGRSRAGLLQVDPSALARVPTPGGTPDLASYLLTLPGVVTAGDRGGQLFIRGGTPTQNLVLIDGMPLYQPFHIVGFYSAFPADIISYADVYAGGFGARYGGRLSSVIDVSTRNGSKQRVAGALTLAPFLSAVRLEVPFVPERVSILASLRESVIERIAPDVLGQELPYRFGDRFFKLHAFLNQTSSLSLTALRTFDDGDVANTAGESNRVTWRNAAYGGRYVYLPETYPALTQASFYTSRLESRYRRFDASLRTASVEGSGGEIKFIYFLTAAELHFGVFGRTYQFAYDTGAATSLREAVTEGGMYLDAHLEVSSRLHLEPGLRLHAFPSRNRFTWEPRLRSAWRPGGRTGRHTLHAAWGLYHQEIIGLYNLRDVTDAFIAWAPSPPHRDVPRAVHFITGWQGRLLPWLELSTEAYLKRLAHVASAQYEQTSVLLDAASGHAHGLDVRLELGRPWLYGYLSYGLARVWYERASDAGGASRPGFTPPHDRRHQVNALLRILRGPLALSVRWQFGSGLPFTQAYGFYHVLPFDRPDGAYHTAPGTVALSYGPPYRGRLPAYHRLDLSLEYTFRLRRFSAVLHAGAVNVYDRANIFDYDLLTHQRVNQLPFIPSLGLKVETH